MAPGCPWENGYQESFYAQFKIDLGDPDRFASLGELVYEIAKAIWYYNQMRIHTAIKMPPAVFAKRHQKLSLCHSKERVLDNKRAKFIEFVCGALVPFVAHINSYATSFLGVAVIFLEGLQQLNQWQHHWITYRSTCEALRHEKYSYLGRAGAYDGADDSAAKKILVERVEALISTEHAKWISRQEYNSRKQNDRAEHFAEK